jgi:RHS repeat-associated protein
VHAEWFVRDPNGTLVAMIDRNTTEPDRYYLTDGLGSVVATINTNDQVRRYLYEPYGQQIRTWIDTTAGTSLFDGSELAALRQPEGADYNPWRYASGYYDQTTGMLKFGTRYYIPQLARWTQTDPKAGKPNDPPTLNPYAYVGGNPTNGVDPSGRVSVDCGWFDCTFYLTEDETQLLWEQCVYGGCEIGVFVPNLAGVSLLSAAVASLAATALAFGDCVSVTVWYLLPVPKLGSYDC